MFEHMINSLCLICGSWHKNLSIAIQCSAFSCMHYSNAACGYIPMSTSETWKNNNILKNFSENLNIFIQENALEVIVWKTIYHNLKSRGTRYFLSEYSMKCTLFSLLFALFCCRDIISSWWFHVIYLPTFFWVASPVLWKSYDCPSASEATLKNTGNIIPYLTTAKHNKTWIMCIFLGMYCVTREPYIECKILIVDVYL